MALVDLTYRYLIVLTTNGNNYDGTVTRWSKTAGRWNDSSDSVTSFTVARSGFDTYRHGIFVNDGLRRLVQVNL